MPDRLIRRQSQGPWPDFLHSAGLAAMILGVFILGNAGLRLAVDLQSRFFPVVVDFRPGPYVAVDGGAVFSGEATKKYGCDWRKTVVWLRGENGGNVIATDRPHLDPPTVRDAGVLHWNRIFVPVPPEQMHMTYARAYHDCGRWLPLAESRFWGYDK